MSADQTAPGRRDAVPIVVDKLTTVVRNKAGDPIFIGWGPDGGAAATKDRRAVSSAGQDLLRVYERARNLLVPVVPYVDLVPVEYSYIKLKDLAAPAEDYFIVNVKDAEGQTLAPPSSMIRTALKECLDIVQTINSPKLRNCFSA